MQQGSRLGAGFRDRVTPAVRLGRFYIFRPTASLPTKILCSAMEASIFVVEWHPAGFWHPCGEGAMEYLSGC
jgi:hypothetical protein